MTLTPTEPTVNFPIVRLVSENERWECGVMDVLFGFRVRAGLVGAVGVSIDYCAGDNRLFLLELLSTIVIILESLPESVTEAEVKRMMPGYECRPIYLDPCWPKLQAMASEIFKLKTAVTTKEGN